ncbi:phage major tail tube protein [Cetobacterium sp. 2A]|uniref:phage major tail tube protein n=1 Tax=Cetobacterium sp. 2A TaxID=2754723 RepID=UPI00163B71C0|nr:phage major tail tube protein [Cetobacterium sp. 2A]MBC2855361.1 phage major tail tube protein [Cetobacterium sp. 2A]
MGIIPSLIADALVKVNGSQTVGLASYNLPEISYKEEEITGLGTGSRKEILKNSIESLSMSLKIRGVDKEAISILKKNKVTLVLAAAVQVDGDDLSYLTIVATVKGSVKSFKMGEISKAGKLEPEMELNLDYYKLEINDEVIHEIDQINNTLVIDGRDIYDGIKAALGG